MEACKRRREGGRGTLLPRIRGQRGGRTFLPLVGEDLRVLVVGSQELALPMGPWLGLEGRAVCALSVSRL